MQAQRKITVFREISGDFQSVGSIISKGDDILFSYSNDYLANKEGRAVSVCLPLRPETFSASETKAFFDGLLPEGALRRNASSAIHADGHDTASLLMRLNLESVGALVFAEEGVDPTADRSYEALPFSQIEEFARAPHRKALEFSMTSRLSLAGAQSKIGLLHEGVDPRSGWFIPEGSAASTHILKAVDGTFPNQTVNEALCLKTAEKLGFETARSMLIPVEGQEPLLCVERFDRTRGPLGRVCRRHQEDFCQASGLTSSNKYEPTDGNYLNRMALVIAKESANPFGDRMLLFESLLLDWAIGNCDNHLKNRSLLWSADWGEKTLSPLYDITNTTIYPALDKEMGVSLCPSRRIDDVELADIVDSAKQAGIAKKLALGQLEGFRDEFEKALDQAENELVAQAFPEASLIASHIREEWKKKVARL